jgi:hypothetical protein
MPIYFKRERDHYGEFSNFYMCEFRICAREIFVDVEFDSELVDKTITVYSAEQAITWMKSILMTDTETALLVERTFSAKECSRLGREIAPFDDDKWIRWREEIALYVLTEKFSSSEHLHSALQNTKGQSLAEASAHDRVWGIGIGKRQALKGMKWQGENLLGKTLMTVRENLNMWNLDILRLSNVDFSTEFDMKQ